MSLYYVTITRRSEELNTRDAEISSTITGRMATMKLSSSEGNEYAKRKAKEPPEGQGGEREVTPLSKLNKNS